MTPQYLTWTITSLLYETRRKNPLVHKGLSFKTAAFIVYQGKKKTRLTKVKYNLGPTMEKYLLKLFVKPNGILKSNFRLFKELYVFPHTKKVFYKKRFAYLPTLKISEP